MKVKTLMNILEDMGEDREVIIDCSMVETMGNEFEIAVVRKGYEDNVIIEVGDTVEKEKTN